MEEFYSKIQHYMKILMLTSVTKRDIKLSMEDLTISENGPKRLYMKRKIYVQKFKKLQLFLLQQHHNLASQGYLHYKAIF